MVKSRRYENLYKRIGDTMCEYTWLDGTIWICSLMEKPCPFVKPQYNDLCIEMKVQLCTGKCENKK